MPSIYFTEDHETFRKSVRDFMESEVAPHANDWEAAREVPRTIWRRMGELGFLGILFPEEYGGTAADIFYAIAFLEELARSRMGGFAANVAVQQFIATGAILRHGSEEQKQSFLVPSISGEKIGAICISEPDIGSDVASLKTSARRDGSDFVIDGAKMWATNGVLADFYVVACRTDRDAGAAGISLLAFDTNRPGITRNRINKLGWHTSDTAEIAFDGVRVPATSLVGAENRGFYYIMETFALERLVGAATAIGACDLALEITLDYMKQREAFGRTISKFQALRHRFADLAAEVESVRQLVYHTAWLHQSGHPAVKESAMSKMLATELNKRVADECLQFFGGYGYTDEYVISRFFRDARVSTIVAGTTEIMREIIARSVIDDVRFEAVADERPAEVRKPAEAPLPAPAGTPNDPIAAIFHSLPSRLRAEKSEGWASRFHFRITDAKSPEWTVVVDGPRCEVKEGLEGVPSCIVTTTREVYLGIENGTRDPQMAFMMGKVKISNLGEMMRFAKAFRKAS